MKRQSAKAIVSGIRKTEGRDLIQITSPISHGSSGGPILNTKGEVVGVAVGILEDGQNLNFAVPVADVRSLLNQKPDRSNVVLNAGQSLNEAKALAKKRDEEGYSAEPSSPYQQDTRRLIEILKQIDDAAKSEEVLKDLACLGTTGFDLSEYGLKAAQSLAKSSPSPDSHALLSYVLLVMSQNENLVSSFAADGSPEKASAKLAHDEYLVTADAEARLASKSSKGNAPLVAEYVLGTILTEHEHYAEAIAPLSRVVNGRPTVCGTDLAESAYRSLIAAADKASGANESEKWFRRYASIYEPPAYQWDLEGDRRNSVHDYISSADAYERAAKASSYYSYDYCYAASARYFQPKTDPDAVLADGRSCVAASIKETAKASQDLFSQEMPVTYRVMAEVLNERGVYRQAMEYIKESLAAKPDDPFSLDTEAEIFSRLEKYSECIAAEQDAINSSDGKYPGMHFRLGYCYFATENWSKAVASFRLAAEGDKTDAVSAFNLGLSLSRQGYEADAQRWFREALTRNPDSATRSKILGALK